MPSLKKIFHIGDKDDKGKKADGDLQRSGSKLSRNTGHAATGSASSTTPSIPYEDATQRQAPRMGDKPLPGSGRASEERSRALRSSYSQEPMKNKPFQTEPPLPTMPRDADLHNDMQQMSLGSGAASSGRQSSDIAPRNFSQPMSSQQTKITENVADRGLHANQSRSSRDLPPPLSVSKIDSNGLDARSAAAAAPRTSRDSDRGSRALAADSPRRGSVGRKAVGGIRAVPGEEQSIGNGKLSSAGVADTSLNQDRGISSLGGQKDQSKFLVQDAAQPIALEGIVDLSNTTDTTVHETWAPAVVRETVHRQIHHIREEQITREIHYHDVFHRVLPIIDIEVLPARHFVPTANGGRVEIAAEEIPGRTREHIDWVIAETVSKLPSHASPSTFVPRQFTARQFPGTEGDFKSYVENGIKKTETTWVHPPVLEQYSEWTGQTTPFHFNFPHAADNGLQARVPMGEIVGSSPLHARQHQTASSSTQAFL